MTSWRTAQTGRHVEHRPGGRLEHVHVHLQSGVNQLSYQDPQELGG